MIFFLSYELSEPRNFLSPSFSFQKTYGEGGSDRKFLIAGAGHRASIPLKTGAQNSSEGRGVLASILSLKQHWLFRRKDEGRFRFCVFF